MNWKGVGSLLRGAFSEWRKDNAPKLAASLAFYTLFSLAPVLIIITAIAGSVFGQETAQSEVLNRVRNMVGEQGTRIIGTIVTSQDGPGSRITATVIGIFTLLLAATAVFVDLQESLDMIWKATPKPGRGVLGALRGRFLSFCMVLGIGLFLLISLSLSTTISALTALLGSAPELPGHLWPFLNFFVFLAAAAVLFAITYKVLPDVKILWSDVWIGATLTALLFTMGKFAIQIYLGHTVLVSNYGRAGSLVVLLLWVYCSAQIFFFGAEFTHVYAERYGSHFLPSSQAVPPSPEGIAEEQDLPAEETRRPAS